MKKSVLAALLSIGVLELAFGVWLIFKWRTINRAEMPTPSVTSAPPSRSVDETIEAIRNYRKSPRDVVASYWTAIYLDEYGVAYEHLSSESRKAFEAKGGYDRFSQMYAEGHTYFDLGRTVEEITQPDVALVAVQLLEDPAVSQFRLVKEQGEWKIEIEVY